MANNFMKVYNLLLLPYTVVTFVGRHFLRPIYVLSFNLNAVESYETVG